MEVFPQDARLVDPAVFDRHFEPTPLPPVLIKSGRFWFNSANLKGKQLRINSAAEHLDKETSDAGHLPVEGSLQLTEF